MTPMRSALADASEAVACARQAPEKSATLGVRHYRHLGPIATLRRRSVLLESKDSAGNCRHRTRGRSNERPRP